MTLRKLSSLTLAMTFALPMLTIAGCDTDEGTEDSDFRTGPTTLRATPLRRKGSSSGANPFGVAPPAWANAKCWMTELADYHVVPDFEILGWPTPWSTYQTAESVYGPITADAWTIIRNRDFQLYWDMALGAFDGTEFAIFSYNEPNPDAYCDPATEVPVLGMAIVDSHRYGTSGGDPFVLAATEHQVVWGTIACDPIPLGWSGDPLDLIDSVVPLEDGQMEVNQECQEGEYQNPPYAPEYPLGRDDVPEFMRPDQQGFMGSWLATRLGQGQ